MKKRYTVTMVVTIQDTANNDEIEKIVYNMQNIGYSTLASTIIEKIVLEVDNNEKI